MTDCISCSTSVRLEIEGATAVLVIDRPDRLHAIDDSVMDGVERALERIEPDDSIVVVAIASTGSRAFVAGGDLAAFRRLDTEPLARAMSVRMGELLLRLERLPALVVACVDGDAYGGGCELLLACDRVVARPGSRLGFTQARFGLTPGWAGGLRLVERVGSRRALSLLVLAEVLDADQAHALGLVDELDPSPLDAARCLAGRLPAADRGLVGALKRITAPRDAAWLQAAREERDEFVATWMAPLHMDRVEAFFAHRGVSEDDG